MKKYLQKLDTLGLLLLIVAVLWYLVSNVWEKWNLSIAIAGGVFLIVGIVANYRQIMTSLGKRSTKYVGNYVVSLILVIAIVSGLNYISYKHPKRFDMTRSGRYSLAPQTIQILGKLDKRINIKAFFSGGDNAALRELLVEYRTVSRRIQYEFIDPDRQPDVAKRYDVTALGTVILSYGDRREKIEKGSEGIQEEDLTNAIIRVKRSETKKVYFIQGHGEKDPANTDRTGYSLAKKALEDQSYQVATINLAVEGKVPEDAKVLILAGPKTEPFPQELQFINQFLNRGSVGLIVFVDPDPAPSLQPFLKEWGVQVDNDLVLDVSGVGRLFSVGPSMPLATEYENHKITDRFKAMTFFPLTRSIQPDKAIPNGITVETLFKSNPNSWGETNLNSQEANYDPQTDLKGPLSLAVAVTKEVQPSSNKGPAKKARMVVTGTSHFPIDNYFQSQGNGNLWLAGWPKTKN
jgi:ABC-type uncharacterized transport system involved in gliding motility auxiliary subunit